MALIKALAVPMTEAAVDRKTLVFTMPVIDFLLGLVQLLATLPQRVGLVTVPARNTAVPLTLIPTTTSPGPGLYRVSYVLRIVVAGAVSSSVAFTLNWTDGGLPQTRTGVALTTNVVGAIWTETVLVHADQAATMSYQTSYASNAAGQMQFTLDVVLEAVV